MRTQIVVPLSLSLMLMASMSFAECTEYRIIDRGDSMEAVCVGKPLTEAQQKELEKQRSQEQRTIQINEASRQNTENSGIHVTSPLAGYGSNQIVIPTRTDTPELGNVVVESYDIKYIPSSKPVINGRQFPGNYSVKIVAKNTGRRGSVKFKLKQTDFSGYETESISFSENFEKDQIKTVTTHLPAGRVPFIQSSDWIIETYKY